MDPTPTVVLSKPTSSRNNTMPAILRANKIYLIPEDEDFPNTDISSLLDGVGISAEEEETIPGERREGRILLKEVRIPTIIHVDEVREVCGVHNRPELCGVVFTDGDQRVIDRPFEEIETIWTHIHGEPL